MPLVVKDRVKETTTTTGTGTVTLAGAVSGYQSFSVIGNGNTTYYAIVGPTEWEVGLGTYTSSGTTLSRDTILESSNGGTAVNFSVGSKDVFVTYPAEKSVYQDASDNVNLPENLTFTGTGNRITGDFSNATIANRVIFQTSTTNGNTSVGAIANGTSATTNFRAYGANDPTNSSFLDIAAIGTTEARVSSGITGTGTYLPMTFYTNNAERMRINTSGNVGIGTAAPSVRLDVREGDAQVVKTSGDPSLNIISNQATGYTPPRLGLTRYGASSGPTPDNSTLGEIRFDGLTPSSAYMNCAFIYAQNGTNASGGAPASLVFGTASSGANATERMRIASTGGVSIGTTADPGAAKLLVANAATQDAVILSGRAGGTSSYAVTLTPTTLTASRTLTLPDASTTVVGTDTTDTLTNKTISADNNTLSGIAASSFVLSNASGNIDGAAAQKAIPSGVVVGTTDTQTLTNKTLTDPTIIGTIIEDVFTITDGAAFEVDPANGSVQLITLGASRTPKATNFAAGDSITMMILDGSAYTITWTDATWGTGGVVWVGGSAPTLDTTKYTVIQFWKVSTQVYGALVGAA